MLVVWCGGRLPTITVRNPTGGCKWGIASLWLLSCVKLSGNYKLQGVSLRQAIGESHLSGSCFVLSCWGITSSCALRCIKLFGNSYFPGPALRQAIGELQFAGYFFTPSYWGIAIPRLLFCVKLLGNSILQGGVFFSRTPRFPDASDGFRVTRWTEGLGQPCQVANTMIVGRDQRTKGQGDQRTRRPVALGLNPSKGPRQEPTSGEKKGPTSTEDRPYPKP